jgi:hypothetical protein
MMLTVVWHSHGFHLIDMLPKGSKFDPGHYISRIVSPLPQILALYQDDPRRHFVIHADNTRNHCAKTIALFLDHNSLRRALHPSDSTDLAASDVWLLGYLKRVLQVCSLDEPDELLSAIQENSRGVDRETLDARFQESIIRFQKYIHGNGEYIE